jgi:hypothetical protein
MSQSPAVNSSTDPQRTYLSYTLRSIHISPALISLALQNRRRSFWNSNLSNGVAFLDPAPVDKHFEYPSAHIL